MAAPTTNLPKQPNATCAHCGRTRRDHYSATNVWIADRPDGKIPACQEFEAPPEDEGEVPQV